MAKFYLTQRRSKSIIDTTNKLNIKLEDYNFSPINNFVIIFYSYFRQRNSMTENKSLLMDTKQDTSRSNSRFSTLNIKQGKAMFTHRVSNPDLRRIFNFSHQK